MPRASSASLAIVQLSRLQPRVRPGRKLTALERRLWTQAVDSLPAGYFGAEHAQQLEAYVRHAGLAEMLAERLITTEPGPDWLKLNAAHIAQSKAALAYARSLRITVQSRLDKTVASTRSKQLGPATLETLRQRYQSEGNDE